MSTTVYGLVSGTSPGDTLASADVNLLGDTAELFYVQLGELLGSGFFLATDCNGTAVSGSLAVEFSAGSALVGGTDGKKLVQLTEVSLVTGLTASTTNYVYLQRDGTFTANTTGVAPADTLLACTVVTNSTQATSINNAPAGRMNLGQLLATVRDVDGSTLEYASSVLRIKDLGVTSAKLAAPVTALLQGTPTITVGPKSGTTINVSVQLKDLAGTNLAAKTVCRVWLSDTAGGSVTGTAPDGTVAIGANGVLVDSHQAKTHFVVASTAAGAFDLNLTHSGSRTWYLNLEYGGKLFSSTAVTF